MDWEGRPHGTKGVAFDESLSRYARSDGQGNISVRSVEDDKEIVRLPNPGHPAWVLQFNHDATLLAAKHHPPDPHDGELRVSDLSTGETVLTTEVSQAAFTFSPDGRWLEVGSPNGSIHVYDVAARAESYSMTAGSQPSSLCFHPDAQQLAVSSLSGIVQILEVSTGRIVRTYRHPSGVRRVAWSPDGSLFATACGNYRVYVWNADNAQEPHRVLIGHRGPVTKVSFSRFGESATRK